MFICILLQKTTSEPVFSVNIGILLLTTEAIAPKLGVWSNVYDQSRCAYCGRHQTRTCVIKRASQQHWWSTWDRQMNTAILGPVLLRNILTRKFLFRNLSESESSPPTSLLLPVYPLCWENGDPALAPDFPSPWWIYSYS